MKERLQKRVVSSYHHGDLRRALLDAALRVSIKSGPNAISLRHLSNQLDVTTAAPYHHFKDRSELLLALGVEGYLLLLEDLRQSAQQAVPGAGQISALSLAYLRFAKREIGYYRLMFFEESVSARDKHVSARPGEECFALVCTIIGNAVQGLSAEQIRDRAVAAWSFLHGVVTLGQCGALNIKLPPEAEADVVVLTTLRIVGAAK
jgi:AcrR family transcriptional regulator